MGVRRRWLLVIEGVSWALGLTGLVVWAVFQFGVAASTRHDLDRFAVLQAVELRAEPPDQSFWSSARRRAWQRALDDDSPAPVAIMRIPKIRLEAPVLPGTDERTLDRSVGHIEGTAAPGTNGNAGLAAHRDGFFRGLKDIVPGDSIELETLHGRDVYRVERTWIVEPDDVSVLAPTEARTLTLVTCYPFYFVGPAPRRFIVRAVLVDGDVAFAPRLVEVFSQV
jgi:sortase A